MTTTREAEPSTSFHDTFAFDMERPSMATGLRCAPWRSICWSRRSGPRKRSSRTCRSSAERGGARVDRTLQLGEDGKVIIAGAKDDVATDPKGAWQVVRLYSCKLKTALLVGHKVKLWAGYDAGSAGKAPKETDWYIIGLKEVLQLITALEKGVRDGIKADAMMRYVASIDRELRESVKGAVHPRESHRSSRCTDAPHTVAVS